MPDTIFIGCKDLVIKINGKLIILILLKGLVKKSKSNIWDKSVRDALQSLGSYSSSIDNIILTNNIVFINCNHVNNFTSNLNNNKILLMIRNKSIIRIFFIMNI